MARSPRRGLHPHHEGGPITFKLVLPGLVVAVIGGGLSYLRARPGARQARGAAATR
jgi:hypothetical protein